MQLSWRDKKMGGCNIKINYMQQEFFSYKQFCPGFRASSPVGELVSKSKPFLLNQDLQK